MVAPSLPVTPALCLASLDSMTQYGAFEISLKPEYRRGRAAI